MASTWTWISGVTAIVCLCIQGASCTYTCGKGITTKVYDNCKTLPALDASLAWTLDTSTNSIDFAFTEDLEGTSGWVAWGINPKGAQMVGTQALGAFRNSTGITVKTYDVTQEVKQGQRSLVPGSVTVAYSNYSASVTATGTVTISGTVTLVKGQSTSLSLVWNRGPATVVSTAALLSHNFGNDNLASTAVVEMSSGQTTGGGEIPKKRLKDIHGIINGISWGILLPIGAMSARYLRPFELADPAWFYLHVFCQVTGYAGGTAGWVLGLRLQRYANPIKYYHRNLGISIWAIATFQVLAAILLRPKPKTKIRPFWNVVHHTLGYAIIILAIINIFEGIRLLGGDKWKRIYITILIILGLIAVVLELITWFHWMQKRERKHKRHSVLVGDSL